MRYYSNSFGRRCIANAALIAVLLTALAVVASPVRAEPSSSDPPADAVIHERLVITPLAPAQAGDPLQAILHLRNAASKAVSTHVQLRVDGQPGPSLAVELDPHERRAVAAPLYLTQAKDYHVATDQLETEFTLYPAETPLEQQFEPARNRRRRIIYNNDGGDALYHRDIHTVLDVSTSGLAGSHVDSIAYSTVGGLTFWHDSHVGQVVGRGVFDALRKTRGIDPLELQIEFARDNGMEILWSMRMNDTHDQVDVWNWMMPQWKRDHPEMLVGDAATKYEWGAGNWTALDYNHAAVADYIFEIVEDVAKRYALDGIELDFYRGEPFFKQQLLGEPVTQQQRDRMTELMRRMSRMFRRESHKRQRPLLLAVRVPDSLAYCHEIGLEVDAWLQEGLVDLLIVGGDHRFEPWENMVELAHQHQRPVYACLAGDYLTQEEKDWPAHWRGHAREAWNSGVDGIYTFNFLQHRHELFRQLGEQAVLASLPSVYQFTAGTTWGFLKGERQFVSAVQIDPPGGPLGPDDRIRLALPQRFDHEIHYTLDGTEPIPDSPRYEDPIQLDRDAVVKARSFATDGVATPVISAQFRRVASRHPPQAPAMPLDFFGEPHGTKLTAEFDLPEAAIKGPCLLFVSMMDVDSQQEATISINGHGPLLPPEEVISGSMVKDGFLAIPANLLHAGRNTVSFQFDNLNEATSGFRVYRLEIVGMK